MENPDWWPAWESCQAAQGEYEAAVQVIRAGSIGHDDARQEWERVRREILPRRKAAFEVFRAQILSFHGT